MLTLKAKSRAVITPRYGTRKLGWSTKAERKPTTVIKANLEADSKYLYNPNLTGCYVEQVASYGGGGGTTSRLLEHQELYSFDWVNNWFRPNPSSIDGKGSRTRTAVRYASVCESITACAPTVRTALVNCARASRDEKQLHKCVVAAHQSCPEAGAAPPPPWSPD